MRGKTEVDYETQRIRRENMRILSSIAEFFDDADVYKDLLFLVKRTKYKKLGSDPEGQSFEINLERIDNTAVKFQAYPQKLSRSFFEDSEWIFNVIETPPDQPPRKTSEIIHSNDKGDEKNFFEDTFLPRVHKIVYPHRYILGNERYAAFGRLEYKDNDLFDEVAVQKELSDITQYITYRKGSSLDGSAFGITIVRKSGETINISAYLKRLGKGQIDKYPETPSQWSLKMTTTPLNQPSRETSEIIEVFDKGVMKIFLEWNFLPFVHKIAFPQRYSLGNERYRAFSKLDVQERDLRILTL